MLAFSSVPLLDIVPAFSLLCSSILQLQFESDAREGRLTHIDPKAKSPAMPMKKPPPPPILNVDVATRDDFPTPLESEVNTVDDGSSNDKQIEDKQQQQQKTVSSELENQPDKALEQSESCQQQQQQPISNRILDKQQDIPHERNDLCQPQQQQQHGMYNQQQQQHSLVNGRQEEAHESNPYGGQQQNMGASELNYQQQQQQRELDELKGQHYEDGCDKPPPAQHQQLESCQPSGGSSTTVSNESRDSNIKDRTLPSKGLYHGNNVTHSSSNECTHPGSLSVM